RSVGLLVAGPTTPADSATVRQTGLGKAAPRRSSVQCGPDAGAGGCRLRERSVLMAQHDATTSPSPGASAASRRALLVNAAASWLAFAAGVVVTFFLSPILIQGRGDRRYGIWALVDSVLAYLTLFDLGVAAAVVRYVARFEAARDRKELNRVFNTSLCIFS